MSLGYTFDDRARVELRVDSRHGGLISAVVDVTLFNSEKKLGAKNNVP